MKKEKIPILFADVLGFAALSMSRDGSVMPLKPVLKIPDSLNALLDEPLPSKAPTLAQVFTGFHRAVNFQAAQHRREEMLALTFSDSVYVALPGLLDLGGFARGLFRNLIGFGVPVRMGIAYGSINLLRTNVDKSGTTEVTAAQFAGRGVVEAYYAAEKGPERGLGIYLSPSVKAHPDFASLPIVPLKRPNEHAFAQVDYVYQSQGVHDFMGRDVRISQLKRRLERLRSFVGAPDLSAKYTFALNSVAAMSNASKNEEPMASPKAKAE